MLANITPKDTSSLTWLLHVVSNPGGYQKKFPLNNSPQSQEWGARSVTVTNEPVSRPSAISFGLLQAKDFFFSTN